MKIETSDHAALRWLERVEGVNVTRLKKRIAKMVRNAIAHGANGVIVDGVKFHIAYPTHGVAVVTTSYCSNPILELAEPRYVIEVDNE